MRLIDVSIFAYSTDACHRQLTEDDMSGAPERKEDGSDGSGSRLRAADAWDDAAPEPVPGANPPAAAETANRALVARKDGRRLRRTTVYLPHEVANRLLVYCAEHDVDISRVVTDAVRSWVGE